MFHFAIFAVKSTFKWHYDDYLQYRYPWLFDLLGVVIHIFFRSLANEMTLIPAHMIITP